MKPVLSVLLVLKTLLIVQGRDLPQPATDLAENKPWFCHDLDCPRYDLVNKTDAYEVRKYQAGACTMYAQATTSSARLAGPH